MYWHTIMLLMLLPGAHALSWSEVHFNPIGNDNGREFIELIGNESLDGCTVSDSASTDKLVLQRQGSDVIMIVESDNIIPLPEGITTYSAGLAIGNGLGNTADSITIACNEILLTMAYNTSIILVKEGESLHYNNGWSVGPPSPGIVEYTVQVEHVENLTNDTCDDSLHLTLNMTKGIVGDLLRLQLSSPGYASFDATADGLPYASGDTLTTRTHVLELPNATELKVTAHSRECDARQRAVRYVTIEQPPAVIEEQVTQEVAAIPEPAAPEPAEATEVMPVAGHVVMDKDADAVPWIAGFGMITVIASATIFWQLLRRGQT